MAQQCQYICTIKAPTITFPSKTHYEKNKTKQKNSLSWQKTFRTLLTAKKKQKNPQQNQEQKPQPPTLAQGECRT